MYNKIITTLIIVLFSLVGFSQGFITVEEDNDSEKGLQYFKKFIEERKTFEGWELNEDLTKKYDKAKELLGESHPEILYFEAMNQRIEIDDFDFQNALEVDMLAFWYYGNAFIESVKDNDPRKVHISNIIGKFIYSEVLTTHQNGQPKKVLVAYITEEALMPNFAEFGFLLLDDKGGLLNKSETVHATDQDDNSYPAYRPIAKFYKDHKEKFRY